MQKRQKFVTWEPGLFGKHWRSQDHTWGLTYTWERRKHEISEITPQHLWTHQEVPCWITSGTGEGKPTQGNPAGDGGPPVQRKGSRSYRRHCVPVFHGSGKPKGSVIEQRGNENTRKWYGRRGLSQTNQQSPVETKIGGVLHYWDHKETEGKERKWPLTTIPFS